MLSNISHSPSSVPIIRAAREPKINPLASKTVEISNRLDGLGIPNDIKDIKYILIDHINSTDDTNAKAIGKSVEWYALACIYYEYPDRDEIFKEMGITVRNGLPNNFTPESLLGCKQYKQFALFSFLQVVDSGSTVDGKTHYNNIINFESCKFSTDPPTNSDSSSNNIVYSI